jgi:hypothetical protein
VLGKALDDQRSALWPSAILSGVDGNKSFLHGNELTNLEKYAGYLKLVPRVQADVEQALYFACKEFDDLFVLLCLRYLGPRAQEAFNLWRCKEHYADDDEVTTPWSDDEVIAILPGTYNFLARTVEAGAGDRGAAQDLNCLAEFTAATGRNRVQKILYAQQLFVIGIEMADKDAMGHNFEHLVVELLRQHGFVVYPMDFYKIHVELWRPLFGCEYFPIDDSDRGLNEGFVTTMAAWDWLFHYLGPLQSNTKQSVDEMKRKLGW